jgi:hypothetical protein
MSRILYIIHNEEATSHGRAESNDANATDNIIIIIIFIIIIIINALQYYYYYYIHN